MITCLLWNPNDDRSLSMSLKVLFSDAISLELFHYCRFQSLLPLISSSFLLQCCWSWYIFFDVADLNIYWCCRFWVLSILLSFFLIIVEWSKTEKIRGAYAPIVLLYMASPLLLTWPKNDGGVEDEKEE